MMAAAMSTTAQIHYRLETEAAADSIEQDDCPFGMLTHTVSPDISARQVKPGIIVIGSGPTTRCVNAFGGSATGGTGYAEVANLYKRELGPDVKVYFMVIPIAAEFYCPESAWKWNRSQRATLCNMYSHLSPDVIPVDVYTTLNEHADEDIYLRTDHHWAPLGGYYAARELAKACGVPFKDLDNYDRHVIRNYVGSMYHYSKDMSVKRAPEDFVYWTPRDIEYTTTYINYSVGANRQVGGASQPKEGAFFMNYPDGSTGAYCTFMGGDAKITKVVTPVRNGRKIMIMKDSFGNAIPGYLFYSFEEVHVIDFRYFKKNLKRYVADNGITDVVFANNIGHAYVSSTHRAYEKLLTQ